MIYLLDACAVINLYATRSMGAILAATSAQFAIADVVARESHFVWRGGTGEDAREREQIDLSLLLSDGGLSRLTTEDEAELLTFIDLSLEIDEGEAMTGALAIHRGFVVVTDDRKASRVLSERGVVIHSSLALVQTWGEHASVTREVLRAALVDLRQRGSFEPSRRHPLRPWWDAVLSDP